MQNEPLITWNLVLCVIAFPSLGYFIRREITNIQESAKERSVELKKQIEELAKCITTIKVEKMDRDEHDNDCKTKNKEMWSRINNHSHRGLTDEAGDVVITAGGK